MHSSIQRLYDIAQKPKKLIIGLMSGTSLDGLDIAICQIAGNGLQTKMELLEFETIPYTDEFKSEVRTVFSKQEINLEKLCLLNPWIALQQANMINTSLTKWNIKKEEVDLIASHGQTIFHAPKSLHKQPKFGNATLQIGDGDHLAVATGIIIISDFRQKHITAGGEGAPLAFYGDYLLFNQEGENRVLLNIGGIANFTFLPGSEEDGQIICSDIGPGNTMMDAFVQANFPGHFFDDEAAIAKAGKVNDILLSALKANAFFQLSFPKTTGPELFNLSFLESAKIMAGISAISVEDTMATLNKFSADMIVEAIMSNVKNPNNLQVICSGGGIHNPLLMQHLYDQLPAYHFKTTDELGINPDAKEAVLFALLANETVSGNSTTFQLNSAGIPAVSMGKISFPS